MKVRSRVTVFLLGFIYAYSLFFVAAKAQDPSPFLMIPAGQSGSYCSAFYADLLDDSDPLVFSAAHCGIQGTWGIIVTDYLGRTYYAEFAFEDAELDVIAYRIGGFESVTAPLVAAHEAIEVGDRFYTFATPLSYGLTYFEGVYGGLNSQGHYVDISMDFGSSGAALLDQSGRIVGLLNLGLMNDALDGGFFVPISDVIQSLRKSSSDATQ